MRRHTLAPVNVDSDRRCAFPNTGDGLRELKQEELCRTEGGFWPAIGVGLLLIATCGNNFRGCQPGPTNPPE